MGESVKAATLPGNTKLSVGAPVWGRDGDGGRGEFLRAFGKNCVSVGAAQNAKASEKKGHNEQQNQAHNSQARRDRLLLLRTFVTVLLLLVLIWRIGRFSHQELLRNLVEFIECCRSRDAVSIPAPTLNATVNE